MAPALHLFGAMPTVLRIGPYALVFFSSDGAEPPHVHVKRDRKVAKFWLNPVSIANNRGFKAHELNHIRDLVVRYETILIESWYDYFDS